MRLKPLDGVLKIRSHKALESALKASRLKPEYQDEIRLLFRSFIMDGFARVSTTRLAITYGDYGRKAIRRFMRECGFIIEAHKFFPGKSSKGYAFTLPGLTLLKGKECPTDVYTPYSQSLPLDDSLLGRVSISPECLEYREIQGSFLQWRASKWQTGSELFDWDINFDFGGQTDWGSAVQSSLETVSLPALSFETVESLASDQPNKEEKANWWWGFYNKVKDEVSRVVFRKRGRCYHALTSLPKRIREYLEVEFRGDIERMVTVDMSATYTAILVGAMPEGAERNRLIELLGTKRFYEHLNEQLEPDQRISDYGQLKVEFQKQCIFWKNPIESKRPLWMLLRRLFPALAATIFSLRRSKGGPSGLSDYLTDLESSIFIDDALVRCHKNGVPCLPIHDALLVPESMAGEVKRVLELIAQKFLGFKPAFKIA